MLKTVTAPKETKLSNKYAVYIREKNSDWKKTDVFVALCPDGISNWQEIPDEIYREFNRITHGNTAVKTYFCNFEFDEYVEVRVEYAENTNEYKIKPETYGINFTKDNNQVTFELHEPRKVTVEPDGNIFSALHIFANKITDFSAVHKNVIHFNAGNHTYLNNSHIILDEHGNPIIDNISDDTYIYLDRNAVVNASILLSGVKNVTIDGCGVLSQIDRCCDSENKFNSDKIYGGFRNHACPSVYIKSGCNNINIKNISIISDFRPVVIRNSDYIYINSVKAFSYCANADGINCINSNHIKITDCYLENADDNICVYTSYDSIDFLNDMGYQAHKPVSTDYEISGCILWTSARPFVFGGHGRQNSTHKDVISDICVHDCEIMEVAFNIFGNTAEHNRYWSGYLKVLSQSEELIKNISFENINCNWTRGYSGRPIHLEVRNSKNASYSESRGYRIENINFKNIHFYNCPKEIMPSALCARCDEKMTDDYAIEEIRFDNVTFDGTALENRPDMLEISGRVRNVIVNKG